MTEHQSDTADRPLALDAVVVGAGFAGLYMLHRLRGMGLRARVFERGDGVGGTWYWNRYPGARCDVPSIFYSYSFDDALQQEWTWTERYAPQAEILAYLEHVADRYDLRPDIELGTSVTSVHYDEARASWTVTTERADGSGPGAAATAPVLIMATGCLSSAQVPPFPGRERFGGDWYHTGAWPHEGVDFTGKRVAVIGTGSSGIQSIPIIAAQAAHTFVLQRTPSYSAPARNGPLEPAELRSVRQNYVELRRQVRLAKGHMPGPLLDTPATAMSAEERDTVLEKAWAEGGIRAASWFPDVMIDPEANELVAEFIRNKLRAKIVDPALATKLVPTTYPIATKRLCVDTGYFETYNRDDVTLVDLRETPIVEITADGIQTTGGLIEVDTIVFATGFDAMTGALLRIEIRGRDGVTLRDHWSNGPRTYLGLAVAGFPNLFTITGPGSPSVLTNMVPSIELHVDWIADCLAYLRDQGLAAIEADAGAEADWTSYVDLVAGQTLLPRADSWYMGRNIEGKPQGFMPFAGGAPAYREIVEAVAAEDYKGFMLLPSPESAG